MPRLGQHAGRIGQGVYSGGGTAIGIAFRVDDGRSAGAPRKLFARHVQRRGRLGIGGTRRANFHRLKRVRGSRDLGRGRSRGKQPGHACRPLDQGVFPWRERAA
ncbi:hypothetical protein D3C71_1738210 [compost metagenome]